MKDVIVCEPKEVWLGDFDVIMSGTLGKMVGERTSEDPSFPE